MKRYFSIMIAVIFITSQSACRKGFLDVIPKGSQVAVTATDYDLLMNSSDFYLYNYAGGLREFVLMGDEVAAESSYFGKHSSQTIRAFQWQAMIWDKKDESLDLSQQLGDMYVINKVANEVMGSEGSEEQKKSLLAEAKAFRAFYHFLWLNTYGKPYQASSAGTDPAFPIITTSSISATGFKRASVQEMYDFIIKDLTDAIAVLQIQSPVLTRFSKGAAEALLAKVYLFMGKYSDALPLIKAAFTDVAANPAHGRLYDYNVDFAPGGSFLPISSYSGPNGPGNNYADLTESVLAKIYTGGSYDGNPFENDGLVLTPQFAALYGSSDLRPKFYSDVQPNGVPDPGGRLRPYGIKYIRFGIELSEMYLLSAEIKARTNDLAGAVGDVEMLRKNRMPAADAPVPGGIAGDQTALIKFIIDERTREFAFTGLRWFDMRRLSVDPLFTGVTFTHTLYDPSGNTVYTLKAPERLTLQIPQFYIDANPGMENNP